MNNDLFVTASGVAKELGVSKPCAYELVKRMNEKLEQQGFITSAGKVNRKYYQEKIYGVGKAELEKGA